ncbi:MAG TPA: DUF1566 domain-containing protein [Spirochaetota bacterium]|nr:DUF1566 domain-containing protein [Spirochaetota bacterium]HRZ26735.1 DUF1566 domain-containing protein [Spirochaetota bacterium]HSA13416.1 DUF1566 domain-containing protein [Spirochaetota bacterium]
MKKHLGFFLLSLFFIALAISACDDGGDNGGGIIADTVIDLAAIPGVTPPAYGETPVPTISETDQYTGTVSWSDSPVTFEARTVYTATITLTAKSGYTLTGVTADFFTVAEATSDTNSADSGVVTAVFPKTDWATYNLRDTGPAGGLIFYINPNAEEDGWKYLEAAPVSTEWTDKVWGGRGTFVTAPAGTATAIGTGRQNTIDIVSAFGDTEPYESKTDYAAKLCSDLSSGGYDDWFLPSKDELYEMCWVLHSRRWNSTTSLSENNPAYGTTRVGGFSNTDYWSSSETAQNIALTYSFGMGYEIGSAKNNPMLVRAVRSF